MPANLSIRSMTLVHFIFHGLNLLHIRSVQRPAAVNPLFHFTQNGGPAVKSILCSASDLTSPFIMPCRRALCAVMAGRRGELMLAQSGPPEHQRQKPQSGAVAPVKVMTQWKPFASYPCTGGKCPVISGQRCFVPDPKHVI